MTVTNAKHVVWDWNGTLLDDVTACVDAINRMLDVRNLPRITRDLYRDVFEFPVQNYYLRLGFDLASEDWDAMAKEFHGHYHETAKKAGLRAGTWEVLAALHECRVPMSILSASERGILERMLSREKIDHFFEHVYGLDNLYAESKVDLGRELVSSLSLDPSRIVLIGDTTHDYEVAGALDCRCLLIAGGHQSDARLEACDCDVVPSIADVVNWTVQTV